MILAPHLQLLCIIDNLNEELSKYKNTPNANNYVVEKRTALIKELNELHDNIVNLNLDSVTVDIYNEIKQMKQQDSTIDSYSILIKEKAETKRTATIVIDNFLPK